MTDRYALKLFEDAFCPGPGGCSRRGTARPRLPIRLPCFAVGDGNRVWPHRECYPRIRFPPSTPEHDDHGLPPRPPPFAPPQPPEQTRRLLAQFSPEDRVLVVIAADPDALASALAFKRLLCARWPR